MSNVLIRDVPADDLDQIRAAASADGVSLQSYLLTTVRAQAAFLRRQSALARTADRLANRREVPAEERAAVLGAIEDGHRERAQRLGGWLG